MKVERFNTEPLVVTGDTPDELERRAIERAEQLTGVSGRELTVKGWYVIYAGQFRGQADAGDRRQAGLADHRERAPGGG
jgi:hypothetical protein